MKIIMVSFYLMSKLDLTIITIDEHEIHITFREEQHIINIVHCPASIIGLFTHTKTFTSHDVLEVWSC